MEELDAISIHASALLEVVATDYLVHLDRGSMLYERQGWDGLTLCLDLTMLGSGTQGDQSSVILYSKW